MDDQKLVIKSNELIEGQYRLSAFAQKIAASVISCVDPRNDGELPDFFFSTLQIAKLLDVTRDAARHLIDKATIELKGVVITLRDPVDHGSYARVGLFRICRFDRKNDTVSFQFEQLLEPHIRDFAQNFTKYQLAQIRSLVSKYSVRLYEILRKAHPIACKRAKSFYFKPIGELRDMLGVNIGAYEGRFDRFRAQVIEVAQKELAKKTDLAFDFECLRKGRKVGAIKFTIRHNEHFEASKTPETAANQPMAMAMAEVDGRLVAMLRTQLPDIADDELQILAASHSRETLMDALLSLAGAIARQEIQTTPFQYFLGVLAKKRREKPREHQTTLEKLVDRSWAAGMEILTP